MSENTTLPPRYTFSGIPNTKAGRAFLALVRTYLNTETYQVTVRANGPRKAAAAKDGRGGRGYSQSLPLRHAETYRVYFDSEVHRESERRQWQQHFERYYEVVHAKNALAKALVGAEGQKRQIEAELLAALKDAERLRHEAQMMSKQLNVEVDHSEQLRLSYNALSEMHSALRDRVKAMPWLALKIEQLRDWWKAQRTPKQLNLF